MVQAENPLRVTHIANRINQYRVIFNTADIYRVIKNQATEILKSPDGKNNIPLILLENIQHDLENLYEPGTTNISNVRTKKETLLPLLKNIEYFVRVMDPKSEEKYKTALKKRETESVQEVKDTSKVS